LFFLDYFATGKLDVPIAKKIIIGIADACKSSNCALIGGETAEMPGVYRGDDFDLAGFAVGALERGKTLPTGISTGDAVIALPSSGIHSNGFSLVRKVIAKSGLTWSDKAPFDTVTLGNIFLRPTQLYVMPVLKLINENFINGVAHITGGGLTENIPRILDGNMGILIDTSAWEFPSEFKWLKSVGNIEQAEMLKTFNCGIGMVLVINNRTIDNVLSLLKNECIDAFQIGEITNSGKLEYHGLKV